MHRGFLQICAEKNHLFENFYLQGGQQMKLSMHDYYSSLETKQECCAPLCTKTRHGRHYAESGVSLVKRFCHKFSQQFHCTVGNTAAAVQPCMEEKFKRNFRDN